MVKFKKKVKSKIKINNSLCQRCGGRVSGNPLGKLKSATARKFSTICSRCITPIEKEEISQVVAHFEFNGGVK